MRIKLIGMLMMIAVMVWSGLVVCAQQSSADNAVRIRELRTEIKRREEQNVPSDMRELNLNVLMERRAQLRTLLRTEIDNLRRYKSGMGNLMTPDEDQRLASSIQGYEAEIRRLGADAQRDLAKESSASEPTDSAASAPVVNSSQDSSNAATAVDSSRPPATRARGVAGARRSMSAAPSPSQSPSPADSPQSSPEPADSPTPSVIKPVSDSASNSLPAKLSCADIGRLSDAEQKTVTQADQKLCDLVRVLKERKRDNGGARLTLDSSDPDLSETPDYLDLLVLMIAKKSTPAFLVEAEESRVDKQVGSEPSNGGSTSLVVKGGAPAILGFAVENGALTQSVDKTTITFRGNPVGIYHALANHGFFTSAIADESDAMTRFLRKTSFAFSFDTSRGADPNVFTASKQQLSSFSARIEFINKRKPSFYLKEWNNFLDTHVQDFANTLSNSTSALITTDITSKPLEWRDAALQQWYADTQAALASATEDQMETVLRERIDKLPISHLSPSTVAQLNGIEDQIGVYLSGRDEVLKKVAKGTLVTFEYTNKREVNAPDTSNFRLIAEKGPGGNMDLTFNGSLTMFNKRPTLASSMLATPATTRPGRIRDFQFAGNMDLRFGHVRDAGQFVFFFGGRYERMMEDAATQAGTVVPDTKGDIAVGQFGLKIPIKGLGIKFPISVTFANRTELIKEKEIRGNFGFTFDLDTIFSRFKPF